MSKNKPFLDVEFRDDYPGQSVAENEVFMSFINDDDAIAFHEWWVLEGAIAFQDYLDKQ